MGGLRRPFVLPTDVLEGAARALVCARSVGEGEDAIPVDQIEIVAGREVPVLLLPLGEFTVEVKSPGDETLWTKRVEIR